jgi:nucleoside-diphosphate-sugar epimerase
MPPEKVLITGSNGAIGRILLQALADDYELWGIDFLLLSIWPEIPDQRLPGNPS